MTLQRLHLGMALRPADELFVQLRVRFEGGDPGAGLALEELQRHRADAGSDLEDAVPEVGRQLVGDPPEEVVGVGKPLELDVGSERRSGGSLLVEHPTRPAAQVAWSARISALICRRAGGPGQAAGELADVIERHASTPE